MTCLSNLLGSFFPFSGHQRVKIVDGSLSSVARRGSIFVPNDLTLKFVLYVLSSSCYLISISKLTCHLNCIAKLFPTHCEFRNCAWGGGLAVGSARELDGLFILEEHTKAIAETFQGLQCGYSTTCEKEIILPHLRTGHPSFTYRKILFPLLFKNKNALDFQYESQ